MLLALDINSSRTGWAFGGVTDGAPRSGAWKLPGGGELPRCCGMLFGSISEISKLIRPQIIAIEAPLHIPNRNPRTALTLFALYGAALAATSQVGARAVDANIQKWRRHFIDYGGFNGDEAKRLCVERCRLLGWPAENHDQAEAIGIWSWGMATHYPKWSPKSTPLFGRAA